MTASPSTCYRHPKRESWVLCQRCGNTICGDCQTAAAVGFHCPDCVAGARPATSKIVSGARLRRAITGSTTVTTTLLILMGVVFVADFFTGGLFTNLFGYIPALTFDQPWRVLTVSFVHGSITHILFNGYSLWVLGNLVERKLGSGRFLAVFMLSSIAGSAAVFFISPGGFVVGASGAIFGLFAALFVVNRGFQGNNISLLVIVGINLALGFILPNVAWEAHIGGLIGGFLVTSALVRRK
jgi:membrane associated rhomboid family serine protease